jgi:hypothetical protein
VGPSAVYDSDFGSIGVGPPVELTFPSGSSVDVVITISMDYRTSTDDRFVVAPSVRRDDRFEPVVYAHPDQRRIAAPPVRTSST